MHRGADTELRYFTWYLCLIFNGPAIFSHSPWRSTWLISRSVCSSSKVQVSDMEPRVNECITWTSHVVNELCNGACYFLCLSARRFFFISEKNINSAYMHRQNHIFPPWHWTIIDFGSSYLCHIWLLVRVTTFFCPTEHFFYTYIFSTQL